MRLATKVLYSGFVVAFLIVLVGAAVLTFGRIDRKVEGFGMVSPVRSYNVAPEIGGIVERVYVKEGEEVEIGDTLITIHSEELEFRVEQARHSLDEAEANLKRAVEEYDNISSSRSYEIGMILADINEAEKQLNYTKTNYQRSKELFDKGFIDKKTYERSELEYQSSKSYLEILNSRIDILKRQYQRRIKQGRVNIRLAERSYQLALGKLNKTVVTAPGAGTVITKKPRNLSGNSVIAGKPVIDLGDLSELCFVIPLNEVDVAEVRKGQAANIYMNSYPYRQYRIFEGEVLDIAQIPTITGESVTFEVKIGIDDPWIVEDGERTRLKYGMRGRVEIVTTPNIRIGRALFENALN